MLLLADSVLDQCLYDLYFYEDYGVFLYDKFESIISEDGNIEHFISDQRKKDEAQGIDMLLKRFIKRKDYDLTAALEIKSEEILILLLPLHKRIAGMFRNLEDATVCPDISVNDEYLLKLFAMRVRDRMIVLGAQRTFKNRWDESRK